MGKKPFIEAPKTTSDTFHVSKVFVETGAGVGGAGGTFVCILAFHVLSFLSSREGMPKVKFAKIVK